ncbi:MAG: PilT/PilU family type 4a pilus ATPase, partial [Candidatus Omnitrophota bacterium]
LIKREPDMEESISNRRRETRVFIEIKFKYFLMGSDSQDTETILSGVTKNISNAGMLFENSTQIPINTRLKITLLLPGALIQDVEVQGKVVRLEKLDSGNFAIGLMFFEISKETQDLINERIERMDIIKLLEKANKKEFSDLHLTIDSPAVVRYYGEIKPLNDKPLSREVIRQMIFSILTDEQKKSFDINKEMDFAFSPFENSRFRVSIYQQRGAIEVVFRNILPDIKSREELGLPEVIDDLALLKNGIIFVSGSTGAGKTTTITCMVDTINKHRNCVILMLEKPIEYMHTNIKSIVKQREVGVDVPSFASGVKASLRQDPDVIVVGESMDSDTIETALQAAETGHLVITSIHATDTVQVFDRILSLFPASQRDFMCTRLSNSIRAIINQKLLPHKSGIGRVIATEVCIGNTAVRRTIRKKDFFQLALIMQTSSKYRMNLMQDSINKLFEQGLISAETCETYTNQGKE